MHVEDCPFCQAEIIGYEDGTARVLHQPSCYLVHIGWCDFRKHWLCTPADISVWNQRAKRGSGQNVMQQPKGASGSS